MSNHRTVSADVTALSGLLRQFDNDLKEQGREEERRIVLDAVKKLEAQPASLPIAARENSSLGRSVQASMLQSKASAA